MSFALQTLVAGVASRDADDPVLRYAVQVASRLNAVLHVVHAFVPAEVLVEAYAGMPTLDPAIQRDYQRAVREELLDAVQEYSARVALVPHAVSASASTAVGRVAEQVGADLILVGANRHGPEARRFLGTMAERIIEGATVPVLMLQEPPMNAPDRVLLTCDLSELSARANRMGIDLVQQLFGDPGLEFRTILVVPYDPWFSLPAAQESLRLRAEARLRRFLDEQGPTAVAVGMAVRIGEPAAEIVAEASEWSADVVVLGAQGRSGPSNAPLGSVAEAVLRDGPCSALVIPSAAESRGRSEPF